MNKYLVVSYDTDEQQWFYDVVFATDEDAAKERICSLRPYVVDADVIDMPGLSRMNNHVQAISQEETETWLQSIAAESGVEA